MAHYRKIDTRILLDKKFNALSSDARLALFHLLVHLNLTSLGAMRASIPGLADELNWEVEQFERALLELCQNDMVRYDKTARFLWLPNFLKYNAPESPNVVKSWETALSYLPECALRDELILHVKQFVAGLSQSFQEALPDCFQEIISSSQNGAPEIKATSKSEIEFSKTPSETPLDPLPKVSFENDTPLPESLSIKHKALSIEHKTLSIKQEKEVVLQENNSEEKVKVGEIKNIAAPLRQKNIKPPDAEVIEVFRSWQEILDHPHAVLDAKRCKRIRQALAMGYSVSQLCDAILGCSYTPHNMGDNEQGQRYDAVQVIFRDADQIDRFMRNAHNPPRPQNAADKLENSNLAAGQRWLHRKKREQTEKTVYGCA